jgi:hypothetical protein
MNGVLVVCPEADGAEGCGGGEVPVSRSVGVGGVKALPPGGALGPRPEGAATVAPVVGPPAVGAVAGPPALDSPAPAALAGVAVSVTGDTGDSAVPGELDVAVAGSGVRWTCEPPESSRHPVSTTAAASNTLHRICLRCPTMSPP